MLSVRFRGTMDSWAPLFLDSLAEQGFEVTTFDYSGLGQSTGSPTYSPSSPAADAIDLITALELGKVGIAGWSIGGMAAQVVLATAPGLVSQAVPIATTPPDKIAKAGDPLFYEMAKRENDFEDFVSLFFEPTSPTSRAAAEVLAKRLKQPRADVSPSVSYEWAGHQLGESPRNAAFPADAALAELKATSIPILHLGRDHDIVFPS